MDPFGVEKGVSIRMPSTANLMISSYDSAAGGLGQTAGRFAISQPQSLLNGFFTRIGVTEVVLNYNIPNIEQTLLNNQVIFDISGVGNQTFTLPDGNYTCADALDTLVSVFNAQSGGGRTIAITSTGQTVTITMTGGAFRFPTANNILIATLGFQGGGAYATSKIGSTSAFIGLTPSEQLQPILYLDFVCSQLTYNQLLKDASTDKSDRDVLCRWYMNYDNDMNQVDKYGYAIRMGMKPFYVRRLFNPPKQIRWNGNQPLGQLIFEVYATYIDGVSQALLSEDYNWLMTLQASEV